MSNLEMNNTIAKNANFMKSKLDDKYSTIKNLANSATSSNLLKNSKSTTGSSLDSASTKIMSRRSNSNMSSQY